ncbi:HNH endonuclease family protein [Chryseobacterium rhizosphaerae]|uniref:HNH endonuclease n=1 Tax=Chryseobacterium rhizosphaerae TaxID=395937 RepID=UPI000F4E75CF|nr:HNH endonuclease [Chryseobacterium rhizosphaerae]
MSLPGNDPMEFAEFIMGGASSVRAAVANNIARTINVLTNDAVRSKYVVDDDDGLTLRTGVPKESFKEKAVNGAFDLATIGLAAFGGPEGVLMTQGGKAPAIKAVEEIKTAAKYSHLKEPKTIGDGLKTTSAQRKRILAENMRQNNGQLISDGDGRVLNMPKKIGKGQKADMNQAEIDHIKARSKEGSNSNRNMQVLSKEENIKKSNK